MHAKHFAFHVDKPDGAEPTFEHPAAAMQQIEVRWQWRGGYAIHDESRSKQRPVKALAIVANYTASHERFVLRGSGAWLVLD